MTKAATELTLAELEKIFKQRRAELAGLIRRRDRLKEEVARVESQIQSMNGGERLPRGPRAGVSRPRNQQSLSKTVSQLLAENPSGFRLPDLESKVMETGHKSTSLNFRNVLYQTIHSNTNIIRDPETGCYRFKSSESKATATESKKSGSKKVTKK